MSWHHHVVRISLLTGRLYGEDYILAGRTWHKGTISQGHVTTVTEWLLLAIPKRDAVIPRTHCWSYWPFVQGIHRLPVDSRHKGSVGQCFDIFVSFACLSRIRTMYIIRGIYSMLWLYATNLYIHHDDVIKWKRFPRYWPFARGIHRSPVKSPHKGQWRRPLTFSLIWVWMNGSNDPGACFFLFGYHI